MPLGNLTSQFFANVYLNEFDYFVKHKLKAKYYIRYVDDFVILHYDKDVLLQYKRKINEFLKEELKLELHPDKSKILQLDKGIGFLGFRIFFYHKLIKKKNLNHFERKFKKLRREYKEGKITKEKVIEKFEGWLAYISHANTFKYRRNIINIFNKAFPNNSNEDIINKTKYENHIKKVEYSKIKLSIHKTSYLFKKGLNIEEIAKIRNIKQSTVWDHLAKLIQYNQLSAFDILPKRKIFKILSKIKSRDDTLKQIKQRLNNNSITYDEINCILSMVRSKKKIILKTPANNHNLEVYILFLS